MGTAGMENVPLRGSDWLVLLLLDLAFNRQLIILLEVAIVSLSTLAVNILESSPNSGE